MVNLRIDVTFTICANISNFTQNSITVMESETVSVRIRRGTPKGKYLVAFLKEMAKEGDEIKFIKIPNAVTRRAMKDVDEGKVTRVKNIDELFSKIGI